MNVYEVITNRIIEDTQRDNLLPWQRKWQSQGAPINLISKKPYNGVNIFLLGAMSYKSPYWLSFKQATDLGGHVRKGEKSTPIIFWKVTDNKKKPGEKSFILRYYNAFNVAQCDDLKMPKWVEEDKDNKVVDPIQACEDLVKLYKTIPAIDHGGDRAFYSPMMDRIGMPVMSSFQGAEEYYSTLFHELVHSTGAEHRLNREGITNPIKFASHDYSFEELVAECGCTFLCGQAGILDKTYDNSASYLQSWLKKLKSEPKWIVEAASKASKAADYIQGIDRTKVAEVTEEEAA